MMFVLVGTSRFGICCAGKRAMQHCFVRLRAPVCMRAEPLFLFTPAADIVTDTFKDARVWG